MKRHRADNVETHEFLELIEDLGIKEREAREMLQVSSTQFLRWKKTNRMPTSRYWAFQQSLTTFLTKDWIKKMVRLNIIEKEFLIELLKDE